MLGDVTALEGLRVTGKYWDRSMQHACWRHAAWDPHIRRGSSNEDSISRDEISVSKLLENCLTQSIDSRV